MTKPFWESHPKSACSCKFSFNDRSLPALHDNTLSWNTSWAPLLLKRQVEMLTSLQRSNWNLFHVDIKPCEKALLEPNLMNPRMLYHLIHAKFPIKLTLNGPPLWLGIWRTVECSDPSSTPILLSSCAHNENNKVETISYEYTKIKLITFESQRCQGWWTQCSLRTNILIFVAMFPWHSIPPTSLCSGGRFSALLLLQGPQILAWI